MYYVANNIQARKVCAKCTLLSSLLPAYVQEVGRAGRDGLPAKAILYYNNSDIKVVRKNRKAVTVTMREYCLSTTCRRMFLNVHFGDESTTSLPRAFGSCCDVCDTLSCKSD